jgi:hypothetical protein
LKGKHSRPLARPLRVFGVTVGEYEVMSAGAFIRRFWLLALTGLITASQLAIASSSDSGTLTIGVGGGGSCGIGPLIDSGYVPGISKGSYSPTGLTGGKTVAGIIDYNGCATGSELDVTGFSSNPGASWLTSISCNGVTKDGSTAAFTYSGGEGIWQWGSNFGFATLGSGTEVSCTIVHN